MKHKRLNALKERYENLKQTNVQHEPDESEKHKDSWTLLQSRNTFKINKLMQDKMNLVRESQRSSLELLESMRKIRAKSNLYSRQLY